MARLIDDFLPDGLTKKDRKAYEREFARLRRERELKRRRRRSTVKRTLLGIGVVVVVSAIAVILGVNVRAGFVGPRNMLSDGLLLDGSDSAVTAATTAALQPGEQPLASKTDYTSVLSVVEYLDYGNANSLKFAATNDATIESWVSGGYASLELHPVATNSSKDGGFSTRAANTIACVADAAPDSVLDVHKAILAKTASTKPALISADDLEALVTQAGVLDPTGSIAKCIQGGEFDDWVSDSTTRAEEKTITGIGLAALPAVVVDGALYSGAPDDTAAFETFVSDAFMTATGASGDGSATGTDATDGSTTTGSTDPTGGSDSGDQ